MKQKYVNKRGKEKWKCWLCAPPRGFYNQELLIAHLRNRHPAAMGVGKKWGKL